MSSMKARGCGAALAMLLLVGSVFFGRMTEAHAQSVGYDCGYVAPVDSMLIANNADLQPATIRSAVMNLRLHNMVIDGAPSGTSGWSDAQIAAAIARVRADYAVHGIYFDISVQLMRVSSEFYYSFSYSTATLDILMDGPDPVEPNVIAIDAVLAFAAPGALRPYGRAWGGDQDSFVSKRCIVQIIADEDFPVLSHEIGHCFGLLHTAHTDQLNPCSESSPCARCQDRVCDTPFDRYFAGEPMWLYVDKATCTYDDPQYPGYVPPFENIMAYTWPRCMTGFTSGQGARMLRMIELTPFLQGCKTDIATRFQNVSADTELDYDGTPYSNVILDYDDDGLKDLFISMRDDFGSLQRQYDLSQSEVPRFTDRTEVDIATSSKPQIGLRGVAIADYNNDGRIDLFASADSIPRLYHNNNGSFADSAAALGLASLADSSYAGVWGDFDRDRQIDLYVCRGAGGGGDPTSSNLTPVRGRLLRNDLRSVGTFTDCTDSLGSPADAYGASVAASWADVDGDGDLDLFVGDLRDAAGSASSRFYINDGAGAFTESFASRFSGLDIENVNSVDWADMNNDGELDLVLGSESAPPAVYFNDGAGDFATVDPLLANLDAPTNMVRPVDADLDGSLDLIAVPRATTDHRWLFWNRVFGGDRALLDQSAAVGFTDSTGRIDGLTMADFNGDGDADIYFGRPKATGDVFYRARVATGDDPYANWVGVRMVAGGGNNRSAIGAHVRFSYFDGQQHFRQVQVVDGGSGKGGQADDVLICGLGAWNSTVAVQVTWPGGFVQTTNVQPNTVTTIEDATVPGITTGKTAATHYPYPHGWADWEFTWETNFSCDPALDKVTVSNRPGQPSECLTGTIVLTPTTNGVEHTVLAKAGGGYKHKLIWRDRQCIATCVHNYTVESATDATHKSTSPTRTLTVGVCIGDMEQ